MRFLCSITKARIKKHTHGTWYLYPQNLFIPPDPLQCFTAMLTKNRETVQHPLCHYDLFSHIMCLQKAISKRTFPCFSAASDTLRGRNSSVGIATRYGLHGGGDRIPVRARFSAPVQTGPGTHPASYTAVTGSFPGVKRPGRGVDHPPPSRAEVEGRVELYIYSPSGPSWPVVGWTLPLPLPYQALYVKTYVWLFIVAGETITTKAFYVTVSIEM